MKYLENCFDHQTKGKKVPENGARQSGTWTSCARTALRLCRSIRVSPVEHDREATDPCTEILMVLLPPRKLHLHRVVKNHLNNSGFSENKAAGKAEDLKERQNRKQRNKKPR